MHSDRQSGGHPRDRPGARSAEKYFGPFTRRAVLARAVIVAVAALAANLFPAIPGYGESAKIFDIVIKQGKVVGRNSVRVSRGDAVLLRWNSDKRLELHLHGYDLTTTVNPGTPAEMKFLARATGRFPVELHGQGGSGGHGHKAIFHLEVYPD